MSQHVRLGLVFPRSGQQLFVHLPQHVVTAISQRQRGSSQGAEDSLQALTEGERPVMNTAHGG